MDEKVKKLYKVPKIMAVLIIELFFLIALITVFVIFHKETLLGLPFAIATIFDLIYRFTRYEFTPIIFKQDKIIYKKQTFNIEDIRITLCPVGIFGTGKNGYRIVFGDKFLRGKEVKTAIKNGFCCYLVEKNLKFIFQFYKHRIMILSDDNCTEENEIYAHGSNLNKRDMINEHNKKYPNRFDY